MAGRGPLPADGRHPAASCLREGRLLAVRGTDERLDAAAAERFGLHKYTRIFLPLQRRRRAAGHAGAGLRGQRPRPALRGEQAHPRRLRRPGRHRRAQHAAAAPHRRGAGAQDGRAGRGPRDPAQPAAEGLPGRARLGVRGVLQRGAHRRRRLLRLLRAARPARAAGHRHRRRGRQGRAGGALHGPQPHHHPHDRAQRPRPGLRPACAPTRSS